MVSKVTDRSDFFSQKIAQRFLEISRRECKSKSVAASLHLVRLDLGVYAVETPYFWAVYYHDGRGPIQAKPGRVLVYFKNPDLDPRIPGRKYPVRASDIKRLTAAQFYRYLKDPSKGMIVKKSVGPAAGDPFFIRAQRAITREIGKMVRAELSAIVREEMGDLFDFRGGTTIYV